MKKIIVCFLMLSFVGCAIPPGSKDYSYIPRYGEPGWGLVANGGEDILDVDLYRMDDDRTDKYVKIKEIHMSPNSNLGTEVIKINGKYEKVAYVWLRLDPGQYRMIVKVFRGVFRGAGKYSYKFSVSRNSGKATVDNKPVGWLVYININEAYGTVGDIIMEKLEQGKEEIIEKKPY